MSRLYLDDYINNLQQQIYSSVDRIKQRSSFPAASSEPEEKESGGFYRSRVEEYAYRLLPGAVSWQLQEGAAAEQGGSAYAAGSYRQAGEVLREPTVLIDLMFKNNREFDFKV